MKAYWILALSLLPLSACKHEPVNRKEADKIAINYAKHNAPDKNDYRLYYYDFHDTNPIQFWDWSKENSIVAYDAFVYFLDEHYHANWAHPCRYIVIQKQNGKYTIYHWRTPPRIEDGQPAPQRIQIYPKKNN